MHLKKERELLVEYGKRMNLEGLSSGTSGNISIYSVSEGLMAITPSGMNYADITPDDIVVMDLENNVVDSLRRPSSEWALHTIFYRNRSDVGAVVHTHPIYSTIFAVLRNPILPVHYAAAAARSYNIPCAPYHRFGTKELAIDTYETCGDGMAVLMANHGLITLGENIDAAYDLTVNVEYVAQLQYHSSLIGVPHVLSEEEMDAVSKRFQSYGQTDSCKIGY